MWLSTCPVFASVVTYGAPLAQRAHKIGHTSYGFYSIFLSTRSILWLLHFKLELIDPVTYYWWSSRCQGWVSLAQSLNTYQKPWSFFVLYSYWVQINAHTTHKCTHTSAQTHTHVRMLHTVLETWLNQQKFLEGDSV